MRAFYRAVFDWHIDDHARAPVLISEIPDALRGRASLVPDGVHPSMLFYVSVADIPATLRQIESLGGNILAPETKLSESGRFALFRDPEGNAMGLWSEV